MKPRKKDDEKKIKFSISLNPLIFNKMESDMLNKSKLIELLLKKYYDEKKV
jgi:hypothetical protein